MSARYVSGVWNAFAAERAAALEGVFDEWRLRWTFDGERLSLSRIVQNTEAQIAALRINARLSPRHRKGPRDAHDTRATAT